MQALIGRVFEMTSTPPFIHLTLALPIPQPVYTPSHS
jgi:hypothetical protein